ncbi:MAG: hypothetical protein HZY76_18295 [Anaerolineae bacterium]|nr:MAG: hypothetical protein HZY76_18295 [Anaerolineae bacterium]
MLCALRWRTFAGCLLLSLALVACDAGLTPGDCYRNECIDPGGHPGDAGIPSRPHLDTTGATDAPAGHGYTNGGHRRPKRHTRSP